MAKKLVDNEKLAKLAKALDQRAKDAVNAEAEARVNADNALDERVQAIEADLAQGGGIEDRIAQAEGEIDDLQELVGNPAEGEEAATGLHLALDNAKQELNQAIVDEKGRAEGKEAELLAAINKEVEDRENAVQDLSDRHDQEMEAAAEQVGKDLAALKEELQGEIDADVAAEAKIREDADKALDERVKPLEEHVAAQPGVDAEQDRRIKALEDDAPVKQAAIEAAQAAADKAQEEVDLVEGRALALEGRAEALEEDVARLDGAVDVEGSVKKQIKDAVDAVNADAEALEARVKVNEDDIAAIEEDVAQFKLDAAQADADNLQAAKDYADEKIADLVDSAPEAMDTLKELANAIKDNKDVYDGYVAEHAQAMAQQKADLQAEIDADVKVVADELTKQKDAEQEGTLANQIKVEKGRAEGQEAAIRQELADEAAEIRGEIEELHNALNQDIADEHAAIRQELADEKAALQAEIDADVKVEKERAEGQEAAIRQEMADADEALHEAIKGEMAAVIQSLQASITEDGMLRIALGGIEGDDVLVIREQEIPFVTDEDIDAIIAGLDEVEGE